MATLTSALFDGIAIFGDPNQLTVQVLAGSAASIDSYLSLSPGTTTYGATASGMLIGVSGVLTGTTSAAANAAIANLESFEMVTAAFVLPPGTKLPGGTPGVSGAYFSSGDIVTGIVSGSGTTFSATFSVVFRVTDSSPASYPEPSPTPAPPGVGTTTILFSCEACTPVANTGTATSIFGSPTNPTGSLTILANTLKPGNVLRWLLTGSFGCTASSPTVSLSLLLNASTVLGSVAATTLASAVTAHPVTTNQTNYVSVLSLGASATAAGVMLTAWYDGAGNVTHTALPGGGTPAASATFDSTIDNQFDIKLTWGTASPTNTFRVTSFRLLQDN